MVLKLSKAMKTKQQKRILLVEPDYRSKFPPLGLMKISTYHKRKGDYVKFVRGKDPNVRCSNWDRVYVSSLYTWELPRTLKTVKYYASSVSDPSQLYVGGVGVSLMPDYISNEVDCTVIKGPLDRRRLLGPWSSRIPHLTPDYGILAEVNFEYKPVDAYFARITTGCVRNCKFCAVPELEPNFHFNYPLKKQVINIKREFGEKHDLVILDNNILGFGRFEDVVNDIRSAGFGSGSKLNNKKRSVDFNQGIDARLITKKNAKLLASLSLSPVRLAFDNDKMEHPYVSAVNKLVDAGLSTFTNYILFNYNDNPASLYHRLRVNIQLNLELGIRITGFPMRFIPIDSTSRRFISSGWNWRYLRGLQCILLATRGLVSPNPVFFFGAFGESHQPFLEILSMPDRYIIYRSHYKDNGALDWRLKFRKLSKTNKITFLDILSTLHNSNERTLLLRSFKEFKDLLSHYFNSDGYYISHNSNANK